MWEEIKEKMTNGKQVVGYWKKVMKAFELNYRGDEIVAQRLGVVYNGIWH